MSINYATGNHKLLISVRNIQSFLYHNLQCFFVVNFNTSLFGKLFLKISFLSFFITLNIDELRAEIVVDGFDWFFWLIIFSLYLDVVWLIFKEGNYAKFTIKERQFIWKIDTVVMKMDYMKIEMLFDNKNFFFGVIKSFDDIILIQIYCFYELIGILRQL